MDYSPRKLEEKLDKWMERREIILIKGPRQSGKTTLIKHLKDKYGGHYVTFEDDEMLDGFNKNPKLFIKRFGSRNIFIDESQYSESVGKNLKLLYDLYPDKKFIVTGSGSFDVKVEIGRYLVGRGVYFELLPLDFEEFLMWKAKDLHGIFAEYKKSLLDFILKGEDIEVHPSFTKEFRELLDEFVVFGGFPAIVKEDDRDIKRDLLKNLVHTYIERDVFSFFDVRHIDRFRNLMMYLGFNIGSILEITSISREFGMDYRTVENYISILVHTYIISLLSPFHRNLSTELKKSKKMYFLDTGLRNSILDNFVGLDRRIDKGHLLENFILTEIIKNMDCKLNYWRTTGKAEVDFVLNVNGDLVPIEVKGRGKIDRSFLSFIKTYKPDRAIIFNDALFSIKTIKNTKILFVPYFYI